MYFGKVNPDELCDEQWAAKLNELLWVREIEAKQQKQLPF